MEAILEYFEKHKQFIIRTLGVVMLIVGIIVNFWSKPEEKVSQNELATANIARMEASVKGSSPSTQLSSKQESSPYLDKLKAKQAEQLQYLTIFFMIVGVGFLGYSFIKKEES